MVQAVNTHLKLPFPQNPLNVVSFPSLTDLSPVYSYMCWVLPSGGAAFLH